MSLDDAVECMKVIIVEFRIQTKYLQVKQRQKQALTGFKPINIRIPVQELYPFELSSPRELDQLQCLFYLFFKLNRKRVLTLWNNKEKHSISLKPLTYRKRWENDKRKLKVYRDFNLADNRTFAS